MAIASSLISGIIGGLLGAGAKEVVSFVFKEITRHQSELDAIEGILLATIAEIRDLAIEHWNEPATANGSQIRAAKIVGRIHYCAMLYPELFQAEQSEKRRTDVVFQRFRMTITGDDFGEKTRSSQPEKVSEIEVSTYELKSQVKLGKIRSRKRLVRLRSGKS